ncbi:zeaxanthin glucosyltransferase [Superficieibacter electus]|uniref:Zeaxanthin glucosyltransferase n=1 Tax=Superficieibacter electus TaxID=2022662 RepID=A0A2P5GS66_9ENTR|nr:glycosyltransferase [Superficieibacter electus]POP46673.1 zeaxanthin glucosyltransferase [Superficieibacter electus]POP49411.1 zeaxanthin glucosyltransferase [Superficieibacter electus]
MGHFAVVAPPFYSHVRALEALAQQMIARGHRITFIHQADACALLRDERIAFYTVGQQSHPPGSLARTLALAARPAGAGIFHLINDLAQTTSMLCRELPAALENIGADGVIADEMEAAGGLVADSLGMPFVSVACALPVNRDETIPLPVMPFNYASDARSKKIYRSSRRVYDLLMRQHNNVITRYAAAFGLGERRGLHDCLSSLAQISQTIAGFDFPRQLPACFHAVGPLRSPEQMISMPVDVQDGKPLVFASLGTLQGHRYRLFRTIARACRQRGVRLLIAHCGGLSPGRIARLNDEGTSTVDFTDQPAILRQAQAVITHGGLNTVMDAIASVTPVLAIPLGFDQPGVAARVVYSGIGRRASRYASHPTLCGHLDELLNNPIYRQRLTAMQPALHQAGGALRAAQIVEQALTTRQPVLTGRVQCSNSGI